MKRYNEEELRVLKHLTEEVFVISNQPQLPIVQKMKENTCEIMYSGYKKVQGEFFYCKTCDKESKYPICKKCLDRCHHNHKIKENMRSNNGIPFLCMCGYKCHSMVNKKEKEISIEENSTKCPFNNFSYSLGKYEYYIGVSGKKN